MKKVELVREVLDRQLVDTCDCKMGRVDGVVLELRDGKPPRVHHFELGFVVLAERIHPRVGKWVEALHKRFSVRPNARWNVPFEKVKEIEEHKITLDFEDAMKTPALAWEKWLRDHVVEHLPGGD